MPLRPPKSADADPPGFPGTSPPVIVVGASAGGLPVLERILHQLPADFPGVICAVVHIPPWRKSYLPSVLSTDARRALEPMNHQPLVPGRVYVAPPDHHFIIEEGEALLWHGPKENSHRPAVNALFRSAAISYGRRVVGVILSGALEDGATGLWWIKRYGGVAIVQDPRDAQFPSMPQTALTAVDVDYCVPSSEIPGILTQLAASHRTRPGSEEAYA
jgi:two-component system chemotaxis response regulator CheB